jgi:hypothetical protein
MGVGAMFGGVYGVGLGAFAGALAPASPDVIYHAD